MTKSHPVFKMPLHRPDGRVVVHRLHITEKTGELVAQACKSGGLEVPKEPFVLGADDLENRVFHFSVSHEEFNGVQKAEVRFSCLNHTRSRLIPVCRT